MPAVCDVLLWVFGKQQRTRQKTPFRLEPFLTQGRCDQHWKKMPAPATTYERIVYKNPSEYHYMKVCLEFQDAGVGLNAAQFKQLLISALKDLFGEVDAALPLDVLTYEEKTLSAILRICSSGLVKLWSSLTLLGSYKGKNCAFRVIQVSPFLLALSGNSRELVLN
ncbi:ribonuclease P protein subunit p14 isoform X3 [Oryx dammah]|uniref:ribonuclease P protein subunit p14 isoform X3 n=1 Tax=Oryx dammah TaxID=59534 RepID=UPI001A9B3AB1|nr:ribonuclease P protein subunit p14 isoform X3 [Oryx dammah]